MIKKPKRKTVDQNSSDYTRLYAHPTEHQWSGAGYVCRICGGIKDTKTTKKKCPGPNYKEMTPAEIEDVGPILPCPFCGGTKIEAGRESCDSCAIRCLTCRARIIRDIPFEPIPIPKGIWISKAYFDINDKRLASYTTRLCKLAWNKRPC